MSSGFLGGGIGPTAIKRRSGLAAPVPVVGAELLTNGNFAEWTADNPNSWNVVSESGSDPMVTRVAGGARFYTSGAYVEINQSALSAHVWSLFSLVVSSISAGSVRFQAGGVAIATPSTPSTFIATHRPATSALIVARNLPAATNDFVVGSVSAKLLTLSSLFSTCAYASANCDLSANVTRTAGTQAGLVARLDSAASPANFVIAYLDGAGNVKVDKCVGGTYTNVISGAVTYGAAKILRLVCSGNSVSVYYDGTQVGSTVTVSDAGIVSNTRHGLFSTYAANSFAGYAAA